MLHFQLGSVCFPLLFRGRVHLVISNLFALTRRVSGFLWVGVLGVSGDVSSGSLNLLSRSSPMRSRSGVIRCSFTFNSVDSILHGVAWELGLLFACLFLLLGGEDFFGVSCSVSSG